MTDEDAQVSIELASGDDAAGILELIDQLIIESDTFTIDPHLADLSVEQEQQQIMLINQTRSNVMLIARYGDQVIGLVTVQQLADSQMGELGVAVLKQFWNNGIGTALVDEALNWGATFSNLAKFVLTVENRNQAAVHVYHRIGFIDNHKKRIINADGSQHSTTEMIYEF